MRTLSTTATAAILGAQTGEVFVVLLALAHAQLAATVRVTSDAIATVSNGDTYNPFPFTVALPGERGDRLAGAQLIIDNVDRSIVTALRQIGSAPTVTISVVLASSPDTIEAGPFVYTLKNASYDALTVQGDLAFEDILNEAFPGHSFVPTSHPGLF
ncbi:MAG: hypothetical protein RLZZ524_847 [Pseudomonadota bacterium]